MGGLFVWVWDGPQHPCFLLRQVNILDAPDWSGLIIDWSLSMLRDREKHYQGVHRKLHPHEELGRQRADRSGGGGEGES